MRRRRALTVSSCIKDRAGSAVTGERQDWKLKMSLLRRYGNGRSILMDVLESVAKANAARRTSKAVQLIVLHANCGFKIESQISRVRVIIGEHIS